MLYDSKRWDPPPPVVSLAGLIAWLERQPPTNTYIWESCSLCLIGKYLSATADHMTRISLGSYQEVCGGVLEYMEIGRTEPHTMGAALERARAVQGDPAWRAVQGNQA